MTSNLMIKVSRQQLEYWMVILRAGLPETVSSMIQTVLETEAPEAPRQSEPIYQVRYLGDGGGGWVDVEKEEFDRDKGHKNYHTRTVFAAPLSPDHSGGGAGMVLPERMPTEPYKTIDRGSANYRAGFNACIKQTEELNACLDKVKELNQ